MSSYARLGMKTVGATAAIQGLNEKLERENAELRQELHEIKQLLTTLTKKGNEL